VCLTCLKYTFLDLPLHSSKPKVILKHSQNAVVIMSCILGEIILKHHSRNAYSGSQDRAV
jgi:predicted aconitase with swiveling domain